MSSVRLYCPHLADSGCEEAGRRVITLSSEESHHAQASLRCRRGDEVVLFDGTGAEALGIIAQIARRKTTVEAGEVRHFPFECGYRVTLAVVMGKAHRQSYLVEKCTELGVAAIWPIVSERSVTRSGEAAADKWSRRAIEAAKQCGRRWVPAIDGVRSLESVLGPTHAFAVRLIADFGADARPLLEVFGVAPRGGSVLVLIGPEGGWSPGEREQARAAGFAPVSLSPTVLRTETAAVTVCAAAMLLS